MLWARSDSAREVGSVVYEIVVLFEAILTEINTLVVQKAKEAVEKSKPKTKTAKAESRAPKHRSRTIIMLHATASPNSRPACSQPSTHQRSLILTSSKAALRFPRPSQFLPLPSRIHRPPASAGARNLCRPPTAPRSAGHVGPRLRDHDASSLARGAIFSPHPRQRHDSHKYQSGTH
jgi:hypothetical protein